MSNFRKSLSVLLVMGVLVLLFALPAGAAFGDRIAVSGTTQFAAGGTRIWMNGANTPWNAWNDFGGSFNYSWWDSHFTELHNNGINATRVWITCSGEVGINIDTNGYVSGATSAHWSNLDSLFQIAQNRQVYIMATLISFDHFKNTYTTYQRWRNMITNSGNIDSFVNNYVIPFTNRYKNNNWLWSIDLCNEPDWIYEDAACGNISWDWLQTYFAKAAVGIHANSSILVTVGIAMIKYNSSTCSNAQGNKVSDSALQGKVGGDSRAKLNFYSPHHYDWMAQYWGNPFYMSPTSYGLDGTKPMMLGENPANGTSGHTTTQDYENGYVNGWQGAMGWTSNGVDGNGNMTTLGPATRAFRDNHYSLVFPSGTAATPTASPTATATATPTSSGGASPTPTATATATASSGSGLTIYGDSTTWENWSWSTTVNFGCTSPVYAGSKSISVDYTAAWAGLSLYKAGNQSTSGYTKLEFRAHGGSSGTRQLYVYVTNSSGADMTKVNVDVAAGSWSLKSITLSSLGSPSSISRINIADRSGTNQPIFYIDEIKLVP